MELLTRSRAGEPTLPATKRGPIFVVGVWRSGTSLLYALLNKHPEVALLYEGDLPLFQTGGGTALQLASRWNFWNAALDRHGLSPELLGQSGEADPVLGLYSIYAAGKGASIMGEKSPSFYEYVPLLAQKYPAASFVFIWRDPMAICRSIREAQESPSWFRRRGIMTRALLGCELLKRDVDAVRKMGVRIHEISYSDLIQNTRRTMQDICSFLGVDFLPETATLSGANRSAIYNGQHHSRVNSDEISDRKNRPDLLDPKLARKVERYVRLWRSQYGENWPLLREAATTAGKMPNPWERFFDRSVFSALRSFDALLLKVYRFVPLALLRAYRSSKTS